MTYAHEAVETRTFTTAAICVAATLVTPALVAALLPVTAPLMVPLAVALPFASMTVLEGSVIKNRKSA